VTHTLRGKTCHYDVLSATHTLRGETWLGSHQLHDVCCDRSEKVENFVLVWNELHETQQRFQLRQIRLTLKHQMKTHHNNTNIVLHTPALTALCVTNRDGLQFRTQPKPELADFDHGLREWRPLNERRNERVEFNAPHDTVQVILGGGNVRPGCVWL